jgi:hypothetical protein
METAFWEKDIHEGKLVVEEEDRLICQMFSRSDAIAYAKEQRKILREIMPDSLHPRGYRVFRLVSFKNRKKRKNSHTIRDLISLGEEKEKKRYKENLIHLRINA